MTARLGMVDPRRYPSFESLVDPKTDDGAGGVDHVLYARLAALAEAQRKAEDGEVVSDGDR